MYPVSAPVARASSRRPWGRLVYSRTETVRELAGEDARATHWACLPVLSNLKSQAFVYTVEIALSITHYDKADHKHGRSLPLPAWQYRILFRFRGRHG